LQLLLLLVQQLLSDQLQLAAWLAASAAALFW
jgi:hypothetical protein